MVEDTKATENEHCAPPQSSRESGERLGADSSKQQESKQALSLFAKTIL